MRLFACRACKHAPRTAPRACTRPPVCSLCTTGYTEASAEASDEQHILLLTKYGQARAARTQQHHAPSRTQRHTTMLAHPAAPCALRPHTAAYHHVPLARVQIRIEPRLDVSPKLVRLVQQLAQSAGHCAHGCQFYRHEPVPQVIYAIPSCCASIAASCTHTAAAVHSQQQWAANGFYGPPYALLQGSLSGLESVPEFEGRVQAEWVQHAHAAFAPRELCTQRSLGIARRRGSVCMIPGTKEFFIAKASHEEWGTAHIVWGTVKVGARAGPRTCSVRVWHGGACTWSGACLMLCGPCIRTLTG